MDKVFFFVIEYYWDGQTEVSKYVTPVLYNDKSSLIKGFSETLYKYTTDPRAEVIGAKTISFNMCDYSIYQHNL